MSAGPVFRHDGASGAYLQRQLRAEQARRLALAQAQLDFDRSRISAADLSGTTPCCRKAQAKIAADKAEVRRAETASLTGVGGAGPTPSGSGSGTVSAGLAVSAGVTAVVMAFSGTQEAGARGAGFTDQRRDLDSVLSGYAEFA